MSIMGIGYEGLTLDDFIARLQRREVEVLVDVRLNAISRKRGFSKRALSEALESAGIEYRHEPSLGNAKDNRAGYGEVGSPAADAARQAFSAGLAAPDARAALSEVANLSAERRLALLCYEADTAHCHREQVLSALDLLRTSLSSR